METTATQHSSSIPVPKYTVGIKTYKTAKREKMREVMIYRNGAWIYCDAFKEEERAEHEQWAQGFLKAMKSSDLKEMMKALDEMWGI